MVVFAFSIVSADSSIEILCFLEDFVFLGKSNSSMVSFTFTISARCSATSNSDPRGQLLDKLILQIQRLDHFDRVVGVLLGVLLRSLLRDLLRDFLWDFLLVTERVLVAKLRRCFVDLRSQRTGSATNQVFNKVFESCCRVVVVCGALGLPTAFSCGHRCAVGIDRDPPMCLDALGDIKAKRQPFVAGVVLGSCGHGHGRRDVWS